MKKVESYHYFKPYWLNSESEWLGSGGMILGVTKDRLYEFNKQSWGFPLLRKDKRKVVGLFSSSNAEQLLNLLFGDGKLIE